MNTLTSSTCALLGAGLLLSASSVPASAAEADREARFFRLHATADAGFVRTLSDDQAPVLVRLVEAADRALTMRKKRGYQHLYDEVGEAMKAHRKEIPGPFYSAMLSTRSLAWNRCRNSQPFNSYGKARDMLVTAIRFAQEHAGRFLGTELQSFQATMQLTRILLDGQGTGSQRWMFSALTRNFTSRPGLLTNPSHMAALHAVERAAHGHAKGEVYPAVAAVLKTLETQEQDARSYYSLAREAGRKVQNHFEAYWTMRAFLTSAREVPNSWGEHAIDGLLDAANTYDEDGWIKYPIGSEEPYRTQVNQLLDFLISGNGGFEAYCSMLAGVEPSGERYIFRNYTLYCMLKAVDPAAVPEQYADRLADLVFDRDVQGMRELVTEVAAARS